MATSAELAVVEYELTNIDKLILADARQKDLQKYVYRGIVKSSDVMNFIYVDRNSKIYIIIYRTHKSVYDRTDIIVAADVDIKLVLDIMKIVSYDITDKKIYYASEIALAALSYKLIEVMYIMSSTEDRVSNMLSLATECVPGISCDSFIENIRKIYNIASRYYTNLQKEHFELHNNHVSLQERYSNIREEHCSLEILYSMLQLNHEELLTKSVDEEVKYNNILAENTQLKSDYTLLKEKIDNYNKTLISALESTKNAGK